MGKTEWRASSNGPDVLDVATIMCAIGTLHSAHVAVIISPCADGSTTGVDLALSAIFDVLPGSALPATVGVHSSYPNKKGTSLWGEIYAMCWMLDEEIGRTYKNEKLWE